MSYKTDRLVDLFPDAYAAHERSSLLYKLLDAVGDEFMEADEKIKRLLKSHWVEYAEGSALDGLGAIFGVARRVLPSGETEDDEKFRRRLQATVTLFTGGGTRDAVLGAVRSALGLPYKLEDLPLPESFEALRQDIGGLIKLTEFSPTGDTILETSISPVDKASELILNVNSATVRASPPRIVWNFRKGNGHFLSLGLMDTNRGVKAKPDLIVRAGSTLIFSDDNGRFNALLDGIDVSDRFTNLDGSSPAAVLPLVPQGLSRWRFRAQSGLFDQNILDSDTFDLPVFDVEMQLLIFRPLTFDVEVPFFFEDAIRALKKRHNYPGEIQVFRGLPVEVLQEVVNQTRAAGVRGSVLLTLNFFDDHPQDDQAFSIAADFLAKEKQDAADSLLVANVNQQTESHAMDERLNIAGVFDISPFDGPFGFL
ncbi:MAG TPA: hypothetical protein PLD20_07350 [Blastocatellia bacterium]|nr:hypothetical protein [Blastocatellia bacterium]HMV85946.1 hypothetical protein [Blastocatellia bacterium]HMX28815.1 hypothetical protein [Blastocatellia bacterium]HMY76558.1 hypothetical protein [Blastocatellia bacterium]HMZ17727.1 hypothetical protein [Blastocatellia bacterium]